MLISKVMWYGSSQLCFLLFNIYFSKSDKPISKCLFIYYFMTNTRLSEIKSKAWEISLFRRTKTKNILKNHQCLWPRVIKCMCKHIFNIHFKKSHTRLIFKDHTKYCNSYQVFAIPSSLQKCLLPQNSQSSKFIILLYIYHDLPSFVVIYCRKVERIKICNKSGDSEYIFLAEIKETIVDYSG